MYAITMSNIDDIDAGELPYTTYRGTREEMEELTELWLNERTLTFRIPGKLDDSFTLVGYRDGILEFAVVERHWNP